MLSLDTETVLKEYLQIRRKGLQCDARGLCRRLAGMGPLESPGGLGDGRSQSCRS
jgi:hypothetical protein